MVMLKAIRLFPDILRSLRYAAICVKSGCVEASAIWLFVLRTADFGASKLTELLSIWGRFLVNSYVSPERIMIWRRFSPYAFVSVQLSRSI